MFTYHAQSNTYQAFLLLRSQHNDTIQPQLLLVDPGMLQEEILDCFLHHWNVLPVLDPSYWIWRIDGKRVRWAEPIHRLLYMLQEGKKPAISEIRHALFTCRNPLLFERLFELTLLTDQQKIWMNQHDLSVLHILQGQFDPVLTPAISILFLLPWEEKLSIAPQSLLAHLENELLILDQEVSGATPI